jgi:arylsulfatase A-like enzyme
MERMKDKQVTLCSIFMSLCFWTSTVVSSRAQDKVRPNIIFILADDLGYGDVGFNGQQYIRTPFIDQLAAEGLRFDQFYAGTAVCAPSRSALMTGQHTGHTFIRGNLGVKPEGQYPIADSVLTIAEILQQAGYRTGAFGKWGLGPVLSEGDPNKQGFDQFYGYNCQTLAHRYYPTHLWDNSSKVLLAGNEVLETPTRYAPDLIQKKALDFITANKDRPFFLFLPHILPHAELLVPDDSLLNHYKGRFEEKAFVGDDYGNSAKPFGYASQAYPRATFAAMVSRLDLYVGQVMAKLKDLGLDENTIVIFSSDNGPHREGGADPQFFNSNAGMRGFKRDLYEGGIRVPFVVRWPNKVKANSRSQHIAAFWDVFSTFADIAGTSSKNQGDGISFFNTLLGDNEQQNHRYLYWEFHEQGGKQAVRIGKWKAIRLQAMTAMPAPIELYDLELDPFEKNNMAAEHPEIIKQAEDCMKQAHRESEVFPFLIR